MPTRASDRPTQCPKCGRPSVKPIMYGLPDPALLEEADKGLLILGGCMVGEESPNWHCGSCRHQWGRMEW